MYGVPLIRSYDLHPDGQRFLMIKQRDAGTEADDRIELVLVQNWFDELKAPRSHRLTSVS